ncbi:hypothetical protein RhiJN_10667 [Ceratobasidium sp. AG-Ba]|nr:hypothetical protein RhiJN_10667 [Ceratobasidium sp. AG-Ba]
MAPRSKSHRTLSANSRTHSTTSLHKAHHGPHLGGLTTLVKDTKPPNARDSLVKSKKHSSSSSALSAKRNASRTNVARATTTRTTSSDKNPDPPMKEDPNAKPNPDDEGWVSSESGAATPAHHENDNEDDDDDEELDEAEILQLQTQRAKRNAREADRLRAAMLAAEAELRAQREDASRTPPTRASPLKHTNISPARPTSPPSDPKSQPPDLKTQVAAKQNPPAFPIAPVVQQPHLEDHSKHTFPTHHTPSPSDQAHPPARNGTHSSDPVAYDYATSNGGANGAVHAQTGESSRPAPRRSNSHAPRPATASMTPMRGPQPPTRSATTRPHPLIRAPSVLTKTTPAVPPLTAPPYLSAHSAQAQISSSPPPKTPSSASTKSSPAHTRQPSISSSIHTLPTLQVSPTATLSASVSSLPHSPQQRASSLYHYPTTSLSPTIATNPIRETSRERERTLSAVSSTAALHALANHHPLKHPNQTRSSVQASTFPPEPADTYVGGMYGGGAGAGVYVGAGVSGAYSHAVVGGSGGMYAGKPGPVHSLLPAPYMATHMSVGRWYAPAREAVGRVVRGKNSA